MTYNNISQFEYDEWKLSNPWDDGHYGEEEVTPLSESLFYKYTDGRYWSYVMIAKSGYDIRVHNFGSIPTIDMEAIKPTEEEADDIRHLIKLHYKTVEESNYDEFMDQYNNARVFTEKVINDEDNY